MVVCQPEPWHLGHWRPLAVSGWSRAPASSSEKRRRFAGGVLSEVSWVCPLRVMDFRRYPRCRWRVRRWPEGVRAARYWLQIAKIRKIQCFCVIGRQNFMLRREKCPLRRAARVPLPPLSEIRNNAAPRPSAPPVPWRKGRRTPSAPIPTRRPKPAVCRGRQLRRPASLGVCKRLAIR